MAGKTSRNAPNSATSGDHVAAGLGLALAGFACLSLGDGVIKSIAGEWPGTAVAALRYIIGTAGLLGLVLIVEGPRGLRCPMPWVQLGRGAAVAVSAVAFFSAIFLMPLADATSIQFTSPMFAALFSALILGERIPPAAWIATAIAFAGVLLVLRPNVETLGWAALLPLAAAAGIALMQVFNRMVARAGPALLMQLLISIFAMPILIAMAIIGHVSGWAPLQLSVPGWTVIGRCAVVAFSATFAHLLIYLATTKASAAVTSPMTYVQLLVASCIGMIFYADFPDPLALAGAALIVGAGLWLWRNQRRPMEPAPA